MIYTLSREGGIDFSSILADLKEQDISVLDSEALHEEQMKLDCKEHMLKNFGEYSPRFRDLWGIHKDYYLSFLRLSVYRFAMRDSGIIYGHGASFILSQLPAIMKIKLIAPEDYRVRLVSEKQEISEHQARVLIHKRERERISFHRFFFDADWNDESCYDLTLNLSANNFSNILETALNTPFPQERVTGRKKQLEGLIEAEKLYMDLLFEKKLFIDLLKVRFCEEEKTIQMEGIIGDSKTQEKARQCALERHPDFQIELNFELMQSSYLYFPSI
ncbi:cytidylate kinase family protein [Candidatus Haliotispira prima]|uniref:Cytidylate kinase family protein n=1 Tax=Candidatus Haliotispira prima TaxID=3034016 RepID=A0ABY8MJS0_9SPIO|nr:cytidylate kinase family protein [Candidatus Haliotispira prima]